MDSRRLDFLLGRYSGPEAPLLTTTITSPPYGGLKDYGHPAQIGYGQAEDEYRIDLRRILRSVHSHTRDDGSLWLVVDTLRPKREDGRLWQLRLLPFELAREAEAAGWLLRDIIVWKKDKSLPWSSRGRLRNAFEYVLFFVKSKRFKYHVDRLREPVNLAQWWVKYPERYRPEGKAPSNVWEIPIPVQGSWANTAIQHACPLPPDLVERLILLSTDDGDVVFDPFAGSGVVVAEAERLGRRGVGVELVAKYVRAFEHTVRPEIMTRRGFDVLQSRIEQQARLRETILRLRVVKYPRILTGELRKHYPELPRPQLVLVTRSAPKRPLRDHELVHAVTTLVTEAAPRTRGELARASHLLARKRPLSKFGVAGSIEVIPRSELGSRMRGRRMYAYRDGRTWQAVGRIRGRELRDLVQDTLTDRIPLIVSNVLVDEIPRSLPGDGEATSAINLDLGD